ncbi:SAM-dependent methyltransferase [Halobacterium yunchengense]|uniref:SAM-dependent methyltransferase n=1 Tax=Halobacterium yunchengense TaxID=3108497 RepID=UPI0030090469
MDCEPIGHVETPFATTDAAPRQGFRGDQSGTVRVDEQYRRGLTGFEVGDTVLVMWWADRADRSVLRVRGGDRGVFTTRSPARPNPVCLTACEVLAVDEAAGTLDVDGVYMADGSPVLDLKRTLDAAEGAPPGE